MKVAPPRFLVRSSATWRYTEVGHHYMLDTSRLYSNLVVVGFVGVSAFVRRRHTLRLVYVRHCTSIKVGPRSCEGL